RNRTDLSDRIPGGGIYSTVGDMLSFGNALLMGKLVSEASFQEMMTDSGLKKQGNPYGLGLFLYGVNLAYGNVVGHSGGQNGASVQLMLLPKIGATVFTASNTSRVWDDIFLLSVQYFQLVNEL
ncbi:MAG: serine hydrolase domain-containing protein, partial [Bacteroidota bacterium]